MKRVLVLLAICVVVLRCAAQTPDTATINGQVLDQTRAAVPGVRVTATNLLTGLQRVATTDNSGRFSMPGLPIAGRYKLSAMKQGFAEANLNEIRLIGGRTAQLEIALAAAGVPTEITVTGVVGEVRADQPQLGNHLSSLEIEQTPLLNRRITYLPLLNAANRPAINQGDVFMNENLFNTNGTGRRQTFFVVDGSTASDAWGRQTIFTNVPEDAVQEMTILTNAFSAEYGFTAGTVVNIVTRTGGDRFHGDLLGMWRPSDTAAKLSGFTATSSRATTGNALVSDTFRQAAAAFSGPIGHSGRTHFSTAAEYNWENRGSPIISPLAPGIFVGHYRGWLAFLRLDHQISSKHDLFFRGDVDSFHDTNPNGTVGGNNLPSVDRIFRRRTYAVEVGETAVLSPTLLNNLRLQFQLASPITAFDPVVFGTQFVVPIPGAATFTSGTSQSALLMNRQYEIGDTLSTVRGRHTWKFGADVVHARNGGNSKEFGGPIFLGSFTYNCAQSAAVCQSPAFFNNIANVRSYTQSYGNANYTVDDTLWSLFVQDDYRLRQDLTFNLGLRYERQTFTDAGRNFAPRVGFAYNVRGDGMTVIRGGFGIYYSQIPDNAAANYALGGPTGVFNFTAGPGQIGFPISVAAVPLPAFPAGAVVPVRDLYIRPGQRAFLDQFLPASTLVGYQDKLLNPYTEQWTLGLERQIAAKWVLSADYVGAHTLRINRPLDVNPPAPLLRTASGQTRSAQAANCTRPLWTWWYAERNLSCNPTNSPNPQPVNPQPPYRLIQSDVNDGFAHYHALDVNLSHRFGDRASLLASYTWSHAIDNVDPDIPGQNPNDPNFTGVAEKGNAIFDQRHRFVLSGFYTAPLKINVGGVATLASGVPFNIVTGANNLGDTGATADRPVINGAVVGRNTGRGRAIYDVSPFVERPFAFSERVRLKLRAEAFNVLNHANFIGYNGTWGNGEKPAAGFGDPSIGITAQLPARSLQFSARLSF